MFEVEETIVIDRPVAEVFAFVADQTNAHKWQRGIAVVRRQTPEPIGVGARHEVVRKFLGREISLTNEYVRYDPNQVVTFTAITGPAAMEVSYLTEPVPEGTKLTCHMRMDQKGFFRVADSLVSRSMRRDFAAALRTLKGMLESPSHTSTSR
jgi:uncharacterized protein YndB with AHSA1/START domain